MCSIWLDERLELENRIRLFIYHFFMGYMRAPSLADIAKEFGIKPEDASVSLRKLADAHVLHIDSDSSEIIMANPFSTVETGFKVVCDNKSWYANCIWDALGIPAMLKQDCKIVTRCGDCGEIKILHVEKGLLQPAEAVIHFALPAKQWWDDIVYT